VEGDGTLIMELNPRKLVGDNTKTVLSFQLAESDKVVNLDKFQLKVSLVKQEGDIGSHLHYTDAENDVKKAKEIIEKLTHFTKITSLDNSNSSIQVDLEVVPEEATELVYKIELMDEQGELLDSASLDWNMQHELTLTQESPKNIQGEDKNVKLKIYNPNVVPTNTGGLKLFITRTEGSQATIVGSVPTIDESSYEIALPSISAHQELYRTLAIDNKTDLRASFTIQLYYQEKAHGNPVTVSWEQGMWLPFSVEVDGNPRMLSYTVENKGTVLAKNVKLQYASKTAGVKLRGKLLVKDKVETQDVGELIIGGKIIHLELGELDFGTNTSVEFEFRLAYEGGQSNPQMYTFTPSNVKLYIKKLHYDPIDNCFKFIVVNQGTDVAEKVQVSCSDMIGNEGKEQKGSQRKKKINITPAITIAPGTSTDEQRLPADFKKADEAIFRFGVLYNDKIINQAIIERNFQAKEIVMKLVSVNTLLNNIELTGADKKFEVRIELAPGSRPIENIDLEQLKIKINEKGDSSSFISVTASDKNNVSIILGSYISKIGIANSMLLYVNPVSANKAEFDLQLYYKDNQQGMPLHVVWQEDQFDIQALNSFIGNNRASFKLRNTVASIDPSQYTVEISSDREGAHFGFIRPLNINRNKSKDKLNGSKKSTKDTLGNLIGPKVVAINKSTEPIQFELIKAIDRIDEAQVIVTVKRDGIELAKQAVAWNAEGVSLQIEESNTEFENNSELMVQIRNIGRAVPMDEIHLELVNDKGIGFKLGDVSGDNIVAHLGKILGRNSSSSFEQSDKPVKLKLSLENKLPQDQYTATLTLRVYHKNKDNSKFVKEFYWVNKHLFTQNFQKLEQRLRSLKAEFNQFKDSNYLSLHPDDKNPTYITWEKKVTQVIECKKKAEDIWKEAISLISKLDGKVQTQEKGKVVNEILQAVEAIMTDVSKYVLDTFGKILKQDVEHVLREAEEGSEKLLVKEVKSNQFIPANGEVNESVAENAINFFESIVCIRSKTTQASELLDRIESQIDNMSNQSIEEQISQASIEKYKANIKELINQTKIRSRNISGDLIGLENTIIEVVSDIAEKLKYKVKKLVEEVWPNEDQLKEVATLVRDISKYFNDKTTPFLGPSDEQTVKQNKQNIEAVFSEFIKKIIASRNIAQSTYKLVNIIEMQAYNAQAFEAHISSGQLKDLRRNSEDIKQMYQPIEELYSMSISAAETIVTKAREELQELEKQTLTSNYKLQIQTKAKEAGQMLSLVSRFYKLYKVYEAVKKNEAMEKEASELEAKFYNLCNL
jgi:hypothetical protein